MRTYFEKEYQIRAYEVDFLGRIRATSLLNYMQDLAFQHANTLGVGIQKLLDQGLTWVLSRNHLKIFHSPHLSEIIKGRTWPSGAMGKFALREFKFFDQKGEIFALATTSWILLDLKTKRSADIHSFLKTVIISEKRAIEDLFDKLPRLSTVDNNVFFRVRLSDLDVNRHVNNVTFVEWALESISKDHIWSDYPIEIEVAYKRQAFYGDRISSKTQRITENPEVSYIHQLNLEESGKEIAVLRTVWKSI